MLAGLVGDTSKKYIYQRMGKLKELARESLHGKKTRGFPTQRRWGENRRRKVKRSEPED